MKHKPLEWLQFLTWKLWSQCSTSSTTNSQGLFLKFLLEMSTHTNLEVGLVLLKASHTSNLYKEKQCHAFRSQALKYRHKRIWGSVHTFIYKTILLPPRVANLTPENTVRSHRNVYPSELATVQCCSPEPNSVLFSRICLGNLTTRSSPCLHAPRT